jgi:hypothetical protein
MARRFPCDVRDWLTWQLRSDALTASYSQTATFSGTADRLLTDVVKILENGWRPRRLTKHQDSVSARIPLSWRSWGDDLDVRVTHEDAESVTVTVTSTAVLKTTLIDWGKNQSNVKKLLAEIAEDR